MGYDQNNEYYSNGDQSWRDQTNVYQTQREQPTPMGSRRPRRRSGWLKGILAVLLVVAISFGAFYLMRNVGVRLEKTEDGVTLSMTNRSKQAEPEQAEQPIPEPSASAQTGTETAAPQQTTQQPTQGAYVGSGTRLNIVSAPESSDTTFSDEEDALCLQDIYSSVIDSVVSISSMTSSGTSSGTGIIMSSDGYVITNHHVITGALVISVLTNDNQEFEAALVGSDEMSDLAVLKIDARGLQAAEFGDSSKLRVGDSVVAIGDPLGVQLRGTMTNGIISAINRDLTVGDRTMTLIQTNAALNNGNSGGPLINCYGQVIGINTTKIGTFTDSAGVEGLGFAIPSAVVKDIVSQILNQGYVSGRPFLGITGERLSVFYQRYYRLPAGLYVTAVAEGSSAADVGIVPGDILLSIDGTNIHTQNELDTALYHYAAGDQMDIVIYRSGYTLQATLTLAELGKAAQTS